MTSAQEAMNRYKKMAFTVIFWLGGSATAWSLFTMLDAAVVAPGTVIVESNLKKVQHLSGGIVGALFVREGQRVQEGEVVVRLDDTPTRAALGIIINDLSTMRARQTRLAAERDGLTQLSMPNDLVARAKSEPDIRQMLQSETKMFVTRRATRDGLKAQLAERIGQLRQEIKASTEQRKSMHEQLIIARDELKGLRGLQAQQLVPKPRVTALEREVSRSEGQVGELNARISQSQGKIAETELQIHQLDKDQATEIAKDLRDTESKISELHERKVTAEDQLKRIDIRAPISGIVHQLNVHTIGGVISQNEALMLIVPESDRLIVDVRISPQDIDQVRVGQPTRVRFTAFNQRVTTPEAQGRLFRVSGDIAREPQTGATFYTGGVALDEADVAKLADKGLKLVPGMPAEAFIKAGSRTVASYLLRPLTDQMHRAMRED